MGLFGKIFNKLNPLNLVSKVFGGTLGSIFNIARTFIEGIATGRKFGDIFKDMLKQVAVLAIKAALTYFTGGAASLFVDKMVDMMQGMLGKVIAQVATSALSDKVKGWLTEKLTDYSKSLATDAFKGKLTQTLLEATGLKSPDDYLSPNMLTDSVVEKLAGVFTNHVDSAFSPEDQNATIYSIDSETYRDRSHEVTAYEQAQPPYDQVIGRQN